MEVGHELLQGLAGSGLLAQQEHDVVDAFQVVGGVGRDRDVQLQVAHHRGAAGAQRVHMGGIAVNEVHLYPAAGQESPQNGADRPGTHDCDPFFLHTPRLLVFCLIIKQIPCQFCDTQKITESSHFYCHFFVIVSRVFFAVYSLRAKCMVFIHAGGKNSACVNIVYTGAEHDRPV